MENEVLLPIQKLCRYLEEHEPRLFDVYTDTGKDFLHFAYKCMEEEEEAIKNAYLDGGVNFIADMKNADQYLEEKFHL
jgi:hypothetical protein